MEPWSGPKSWAFKGLSAGDGMVRPSWPGRPSPASASAIPEDLLDVLQLDHADTRRGIQTDAALDADGLQGDLLVAAADEHIGARAHPDGGRRRSAAVGARDSARRDIAWCQHQPHQLGFLGEADVDAEFLDRAGVLLGGTVGAGEQAAQILRRTEDEADAAGDIAGERSEVGAGLS